MDGVLNELWVVIGDVYGLYFDRIICGVGFDEILSLFVYIYLGVGDEVIYFEYGFLVYEIVIWVVGVMFVVVLE